MSQHLSFARSVNSNERTITTRKQADIISQSQKEVERKSILYYSMNSRIDKLSSLLTFYQFLSPADVIKVNLRLSSNHFRIARPSQRPVTRRGPKQQLAILVSRSTVLISFAPVRE